MRFSVLWVSNRYDTLKQIYSPHEGDFDDKSDKLTTKISGTEHSSPADPLSSFHFFICLLCLSAPQIKLSTILRVPFFSGKAREFLLAEGVGGCEKVKLQGFVHSSHSRDRNWVWSVSLTLGTCAGAGLLGIGCTIHSQTSSCLPCGCRREENGAISTTVTNVTGDSWQMWPLKSYGGSKSWGILASSSGWGQDQTWAVWTGYCWMCSDYL